MDKLLISAIVCSVCAASCYAYRYIGCYEDKTERILEGMLTTGQMTIEKCVQTCSFEGDFFAGVEEGSKCFCGKHLKQYSKLNDSDCNTNCQGDSSQKCGGISKISVYTANDYLGCVENNATKILEGTVFTSNQMTTHHCIQHCIGMDKRFALTENSDQCLCGNHLLPFPMKPDAECNTTCAGAPSEICGGNLRGSLYVL